MGEEYRNLRGIIPARAGFTRVAELIGWSPPDHPRSRGVYIVLSSRGPPSAGSSPLARGLPADRVHGQGRGGIIPARAGFTGHARRVHRRLADHPRSRGVYSAPSPTLSLAGGSSPLARGLRCARAGRRSPSRDHPRSRGVYVTVNEDILRRAGSSPLARGLRRIGRWRFGGSRIIPARAGFTSSI